MNRLILLRHGDAERDAESGDDFDRRLTDLGRREAEGAGLTLSELGLIPDLVLASAAVRVRESWAEASRSFPGLEPQFEKELYLAEPGFLRSVISLRGPKCHTLMIVGHNPGLQDLATRFLIEASAPSSAINRIRTGLPTAGAAVFLFDDNGRPAYDGLFYPRDRH
jgi:phosphohistidine phosphatase